MVLDPFAWQAELMCIFFFFLVNSFEIAIVESK